MRIIKTEEGIKTYRASLKNKKKIIGLVPTMGALHEGHLSLVEKALQSSDLVTVSIFVNPTQFNDPNDLKNYPRTLDEDLDLLKKYDVDTVFVPGIHDIYPHPDKRRFDFGNLENVMEGKHRPGHFNGVAQVVSKLFELIEPHKAFFGQKDFQQLVIIRKLVDMLNLKIDIIGCPIIREPGGLAMSSRNRLLSSEDKDAALSIHEILVDTIHRKWHSPPPQLANWAKKQLSGNEKLEVEYFEIVDTSDLQPIKHWEDATEQIACTAVKINNVRLIDNMIFP